MTRLRSAAQRAPQTIDAASELLARFVEVDATIAAEEGARNKALAEINAVADAVLVPLVAERKDLFDRLKPWFAASFDDLTGGKRKSIELGGCMIGYRLTPPKVAFAYGTDKEALEALNHFDRWRGLVRMSEALNKPAILSELTEEPGEGIPLELIGFEVKQSEDFFLERIVQGGTIAGGS